MRQNVSGLAIDVMLPRRSGVRQARRKDDLRRVDCGGEKECDSENYRLWTKPMMSFTDLMVSAAMTPARSPPSART
jgi:hypothetical protein